MIAVVVIVVVVVVSMTNTLCNYKHNNIKCVSFFFSSCFNFKYLVNDNHDQKDDIQ